MVRVDPTEQTEAIEFCLDQALGLQRNDSQYIPSAGLSYLGSQAASLMCTTLVCSMKRDNIHSISSLHEKATSFPPNLREAHAGR